MGGGTSGTDSEHLRTGEVENERPDIVHFGSPCQDLSVAGNQRGFDGERSGLFTEAIRIVGEFDSTFALWENVDGAFSASRGRDFQAAISLLIGAEVPMPRSGKWARAGLVRRGGREVAWRTFDAQFFGVAQRRTRVFALLDTRGHRAGEILFEPEGVQGHIAPSGAPREEVAASLRSRSSKRGVNIPGRGGEDDSNLVVIQDVRGDKRQNGRGYSETDLAYTLDSVSSQAIAPALGAHHTRANIEMETYVPATSQPITGRQRDKGADQETYIPIVAGSMSKRDHKGVASSGDQVAMIGTATGVRRLTPRECERLQGLPDDWTRYRSDGSEISDSQRYKMIGNSVAVPNLEWIARRIAAHL